MKNIRNLTIRKIEELDNTKKELIKSISILPKGSLKIHDGKYYYHVVWDKHNKKQNSRYINTENKNFAIELAQKSYNISNLRLVKLKIKTLKKILKLCDIKEFHDIYQELTEERKKLVTPIFMTWSKILDNWNQIKDHQNPLYPEKKIFVTKKGDKVRNKSEKIIADALFDSGIEYKYEAELKIDDKKRYPDFTILCPVTGKLIYWEHHGRMDDLNYLRNTINKIEEYSKARIYLGDNLITTYEDLENPLKFEDVKLNINKIKG